MLRARVDLKAPVLVLAGIASGVPALADTVRITADRDATLIEDPGGSLANGAGPFIFAGRNNQPEGSVRRALLRFDVAESVPQGAVIESVTLVLYMAPSNEAPRLFTLHRVQADWSEGPSKASGGGGAPSLTGDVTWVHRVYDTETWLKPGGQSLEGPSGEMEIAGAGAYAWSSDDQRNERMRADVILWAAAADRNFGWLLAGDETAPQTSKSFASRENADPALRPALEVTFRMPAHQRQE